MSESKIPLTEAQYLAIANAARVLVVADHVAFFQAVADELKGKPIGDGSVGCAIWVAQARFTHPRTAHAPHSSWRRTKSSHETKTPQGRRTKAAAQLQSFVSREAEASHVLFGGGSITAARSCRSSLT
jgi:hypothetical protein